MANKFKFNRSTLSPAFEVTLAVLCQGRLIAGNRWIMIRHESSLPSNCFYCSGQALGIRKTFYQGI
jgi:hypothetical protein